MWWPLQAGSYHSLALKYDGTVVAWGDDSAGQTNVPAGLSNVVAIAAGGFHSLALKTDGSVVAWGDDSASSPSCRSGLSNVVAIAAGYLHSMALTPVSINSTNPMFRSDRRHAANKQHFIRRNHLLSSQRAGECGFRHQHSAFAQNGPLNIWFTTQYAADH